MHYRSTNVRIWFLDSPYAFEFHTPSKFTVWKVSKYKVISGPYFPVIELNTDIYGPEKNSVFGHFLRSDIPI